MTSEGLRNRGKQLNETASNGTANGFHDNTQAKGSGNTGYFHLWFSENPVKREGEALMLKWSVIWVGIVIVIIATRMFENFDANAYMNVGFVVSIPIMVWPFVFPGKEEKKLRWQDRWTTKVNVWIFIVSFLLNYFCTHYFYQLLGARYTFPAYRLNDVPINLIFMTHSYFLLYHTLSNLCLRRMWRQFENKVTVQSVLALALLILVLSYIVAFMEAFTIQNFPYYEFVDRRAMYIYGSAFYAIYFIFCFPYFLRIDEEPGSNMPLFQAFNEAWASCMIVLTVCDFWRLAIGKICDIPAEQATAQALPWIK